MSKLRQFIEYHYAVLCQGCNKKVIDPEKKKNQTHYKERCPECGYDPREEKKKIKLQNKQQSKKKKNKKNKCKPTVVDMSCRAKYADDAK